MTTTGGTVLVTGATGTIGSAVVRELRLRGTPTRAVVRDRARARAVLGHEVELVTGDLDDPGSMRTALHGVQRLLLCTANGPAQVRREIAVIDAAAEAAVQLVVTGTVRALTGRAPHSVAEFARDHAHLFSPAVAGSRR